MARPSDLEASVADAWPQLLALNELGRGPLERRLLADEPARARIAQALDLVELTALDAALRISPWLDGAEVSGRWSAQIVQICGVTLEPFETVLTGELAIRAVPQGSSALTDGPEHELDLDPEADDPPEAILNGLLPLGAYVVEDLSLAIDPFPRKPGAEFQAQTAGVEPSPFAVLVRLKDRASDV
jgi:hypothetical protein